MPLIRLNKFLASRLGLSRREADVAILAGKVTVDGRVATLGLKIAVPDETASQSASAISSDTRAATSDAKKAAPSSAGSQFGSVVKRTEHSSGQPTLRENPCENTASSTPVAPALDKFAKVCYNGQEIPFSYQKIYLILNKPVGYVCSRRRQGKAPTVYSLLPPKYRHLKTVGRLDRDSSGLLLLTNDGDFALKMTHPRFAKTKIYEVVLDRPLPPAAQKRIEAGVPLADGVSKLKLAEIPAVEPIQPVTAPDSRVNNLGDSVMQNPASPKPPTDDRANNPSQTTAGRPTPPEAPAPRTCWRVCLHEGRNRQIRRTFRAVGREVVKLHRTQFGQYQLGNLRAGEFHQIAEPEN